MRTFTLVIGTFNLEVEETEERKGGFKVYSAKCEKVGFSVHKHSSIDSISFPFNEYLGKKNLRYQRVDYSKVIYKGFTLELEYTIHTYLGICKEIEFEDDHYIDDLITAFLNKVDKYLENTMKTQFTVVYEDFTLDVWQEKEKVINTLLWHGKCEAINFEDGPLHYLDTLVNLFQNAVDVYLKPTKIEYKDHNLEIIRKGESNVWFIGTSDFRSGWRVESATKKEIERSFKQDVDEEESLLFSIQQLECQIMVRQREIEKYLKTQGYTFDSIRVKELDCMFLYAVHPDYWDKWQEHTYSKAEHKLVPKYYNFPKGKVVFIRQQ